MRVILLISINITPVTYNPCFACDRAEYEINGQCCPMCFPGTRVYRDCTAQTSTSCAPCTGPTYTDKPNGLTQCTSCTVCDQGFGLKTVKECLTTSNTVCGVLEGNYCTDFSEGECKKAEKHTTCKPGQFIRHPGTDSTDTVCEDCPENSYSNGSSSSCTSHTDCESKGLLTMKPGDSVSDSECGEKKRKYLIFPVIFGVAVLAVGLLCIYQKKLKGCTLLGTAPCASGTGPGPLET
ncbi:tumor necrosis factor receptor superfamily member 14-like isoform X2 [Scleropages formosus]|nr:tumor necrosis factor receptor superfamily member 14-like isoform X2 [Scleropages formosus]XP_018587974.1 tumor necrosis factor receptor superfamily member 14-like isoform X2 [Scleropages formosus]